MSDLLYIRERGLGLKVGAIHVKQPILHDGYMVLKQCKWSFLTSVVFFILFYVII